MRGRGSAGRAQPPSDPQSRPAGAEVWPPGDGCLPPILPPRCCQPPGPIALGLPLGAGTECPLSLCGHNKACVHTHTDHVPPYTHTQYTCAPYPPQPAHTPYRAHTHPELCPVHGQPSAFLACPQRGTWGRRAGADSLGTPCGTGAPTEAGSAQSVLPHETGCDVSPVPANWSDPPTAHGGRDGVKSEPEDAPRPLSWSGAQAWGPQCPRPRGRERSWLKRRVLGGWALPQHRSPPATCPALVP